MNYIGRKDNGAYIAPSKNKQDIKPADPYLLIPIAYDKSIAELASATGTKYRECYIEYIRGINQEVSEEEVMKELDG